MLDLNKYKYLFLDRDGVINKEIEADYVKNISEFVFEENALEALTTLSNFFAYIFVVTNQRGIGRGKMTVGDLDSIHAYMTETIKSVGGKISSTYFCSDTDLYSINRKPNTGMAFRIQSDYKDVGFSASIMIGNSKSDIEFGKKLGMYTVLVGSKYPKSDKIYNEVDFYCENLYKFALLIKEGN